MESLRHTAQAKMIDFDASNLRELVVTGSMGLAFNACSTRLSVDPNTSSVTSLLPSISWSTRLTLRTKRSQEI